jgi:hypothetical protein
LPARYVPTHPATALSHNNRKHKGGRPPPIVPLFTVHVGAGTTLLVQRIVSSGACCPHKLPSFPCTYHTNLHNRLFGRMCMDGFRRSNGRWMGSSEGFSPTTKWQRPVLSPNPSGRLQCFERPCPILPMARPLARPLAPTGDWPTGGGGARRIHQSEVGDFVAMAPQQRRATGPARSKLTILGARWAQTYGSIANIYMAASTGQSAGRALLLPEP